MKKNKKFIAAALCVAMVTTLGTMSASADKTLFSDDDMALTSEWTTNDGGLYSVHKVSISDITPYVVEEKKSCGYSGKNACMQGCELVSEDDMTLVSEERIDDGEFYYIDRVWETDGSSSVSRIIYDSKHIKYKREIFLNNNPDGIKLAEIAAYGIFGWNEDENDVIVAEHQCFAYSCINQEYPKVHEKKYCVENNCGGAWFGNKYAYVDYVIELEIEKGKRLTYGVYLEVNVKGEPQVKKN